MATRGTWQDNALQAVLTRHKGHDRSGQTIFQVRAWWQFVRHLDAAAYVKGVNRSVYVRRALSVAMAHDLQIPVRTLLHQTVHPEAAMYKEPRPQESGTMRFVAARDDGAGIEGWCPHPGCLGHHLQP